MKQCKTVGCTEPSKSARALYCHTCRPVKPKRQINPDFEAHNEVGINNRPPPAKRIRCKHKGCRRMAIKNNAYCGEHADMNGTREYKRPISAQTFREHTKAGKWLYNVVNRQKSLLPVKGYTLAALQELEELLTCRNLARGRDADGNFEIEMEVGHLAPAIDRTGMNVLVGSAQPLNLQLMTKQQNGKLGNDPIKDMHGDLVHDAYEVLQKEEKHISATELMEALGTEMVETFLKSHPCVKTNYEHEEAYKAKRNWVGHALHSELMRISPYVSGSTASKVAVRVTKIAMKLRKAEVRRDKPDCSLKYQKWLERKTRDIEEQHRELTRIRHKFEYQSWLLKAKLMNEWEAMAYLPRVAYV